MKKKQFVVLGLGVFGETIVKTLSDYGHTVIAIDNNEEHVDSVAEYATRAIIGDVTDEEFLRECGIEEFDVGIVAIGNHLEESLLAVINLKEIGIPYIIAKAKNERFQSILENLGATRVIRPEKEMGVRIARQLLRKNIADLVEIDDNNCIVEMTVPVSWVGHKIIHLNLRHKYNINLLGKRNLNTNDLELGIDPQYVIKPNDRFLMVAETKKIEDFDFSLRV
ncbi:MAG: TrkA family potassium uptake protein [Erysipelotrichaceae bacterium]|nr:TrkA family potassium uptake protein [Erysipelotrichaceae bacterium]